jgi:hypothetical protein
MSGRQANPNTQGNITVRSPTRTMIDEIELREANQLHTAALQISKNCFDFKKLCVSVLGAAVAFMIRLTEYHLSNAIFVVAFILIVGFWISDSTTYFYQKMVRLGIDQKFKSIAERYDPKPRSVSARPTAFGSLFNNSMWLYYIFFILLAFSWIGYAKGWLS